MPFAFRTHSPILAAAALPLASAGHAQGAPSDSDLRRAAQGELSEPSDARRASGDRSAFYRSLSSDGEVRNVILLIGDGMGDSEIILVRNYVESAGDFSRRSMLCRSPANTPIIRLIKRPESPSM